MFRIGILGTENSHATAFTKIFNGVDKAYGDEFADLQVVAIGGDYPEESKKVAELGGCVVVEKPEDMLGMVDAVMVTARDGRRHAAFARPFIEAGIPAFIDKPFTSDPEEALVLARLAKEKNVPLAGGSLLKLVDDTQILRAFREEHENEIVSANFTAPVNMTNEYGNFWFYSAHLVEMCLRVFGMPRWVWADRHAAGVAAIAHYDGFDVTHHFTEGAYCYSGTINAHKETFYHPVNIDAGYLSECRGFANMLRTGEMEFTYEQLVAPVFYIAALEKAFTTGAKHEIPEINI